MLYTHCTHLASLRKLSSNLSHDRYPLLSAVSSQSVLLTYALTKGYHVDVWINKSGWYIRCINEHGEYVGGTARAISSAGRHVRMTRPGNVIEPSQSELAQSVYVTHSKHFAMSAVNNHRRCGHPTKFMAAVLWNLKVGANAASVFGSMISKVRPLSIKVIASLISEWEYALWSRSPTRRKRKPCSTNQCSGFQYPDPPTYKSMSEGVQAVSVLVGAGGGPRTRRG